MTMHRFPNAGFWPRYLITVRPWLCLVSGSAGLVGLSLAPNVSTLKLAVGGILFLATYGLGQALTDTTQTDTDALSAPERPLPRGELHIGDVRWVSLAGLTVFAVVFGWMNPWTLLVSGVAVVGAVTYTPLKRRWWGGPPWNSWIVAFLVWIGVLVGGGDPLTGVMRPGVLAAMGSTFFGYAVFVLIGYLKDVDSDSQTGYQTIAVRFGRRAAVVASAVSAAASVACSLLLVAATSPNVVALLAGGLGVAATLVAHLRGWRVFADKEAWPAAVASVVGFVMLRAAEIAWVRPDLMWIAVGLALLVGPSLVIRPNREQV
jgi:4-hydroxybenzoate polyprenyltransferase